jgi:hypothetical protein
LTNVAARLVLNLLSKTRIGAVDVVGATDRGADRRE